MKTPVTALVLVAITLCAGPTLAQTRPQAAAPRAAIPAPPLAEGTVPAGQGQGQTRGTAPDGDPPVAAEAPVNTSRSNIKKPSLEAPGAGATPAPVAPR